MDNVSESCQKSSILSFLDTKHIDFVLNFDRKLSIALITEHLRLGGLYWGIGTLDLFGVAEKYINTGVDTDKKKSPGPAVSCEALYRQDIVGWIVSSQRQDGGFGPSDLHDSHITSTHYAILVLALCGSLDKIDVEGVAKYISKLQMDDGSFYGDEWGEIDTRFTYCAISCLTILDRRNAIDIGKACNYLKRCHNEDGGFGSIPGAESHAAYTFCCVAGIALCGRLSDLDGHADSLGWWLSERQTLSGGFNGRPEKSPDVCYSWWILATLALVGKINWIDTERLSNFILRSQDDIDGGIADRPGNLADVFHTFFGTAALSLMGSVPGLKKIHPAYALPVQIVKGLNLPYQTVGVESQ